MQRNVTQGKRRSSYVAPDATTATQARVTLALSVLAVIMAGGVWACVCAVASHIQRAL